MRLVTRGAGLVLVLGFGLGCGKSSGVPRITCESAAQQAVDALRKRPGSPKLEQIAPRLRAVLANRCVDDRWPAAVIECYAKATSLDDMRACRAALPVESQRTLEHDEVALLGEGVPATSLPGLGSAAPASSPEIEALQKELRALNDRLADATKRGAHDEVRELQQQMAAVTDKLATARAAAGN